MTVEIIHADCVDTMRAMPDESVGAIVCDPPYGLRFMGKDFDNLGDGALQREWHRTWLIEAYRILRPGGAIKAFGGTRTFHHLAFVMEEVGFRGISLEAWTYGSGFPKSMNIGKALDKAAGAEREVIGFRVSAFGDADTSETSNGRNLWCKPATKEVPLTGAPATEAAQRWEGWGTALKPAWEPVVIGRKPCE